MWNKESQQQSILNQYPQPFLYKQNNGIRLFQRNPVISSKITSPPTVVKSSCKSSNVKPNNAAIVNKINGHQIKDLQKASSNKIISNLKKNFQAEHKLLRKPIISTEPEPPKCDCKNELTNIMFTNGLVKNQKIDGIRKFSLCTGHCDHNHRKKNVKLKKYDHDPEQKEVVLRSAMRLPFLKNITESTIPRNDMIIDKLVDLKDSLIEIKINRKQSVVGCQSKSMRSSPTSAPVAKKYQRTIKSGKDKPPNINELDNSLFKCEWDDCSSTFSNSESLTQHVQLKHINPTTKNDVFFCSWRGCKFSNQPSCSFKWLSQHVVAHCDLKPFKCVIFGCDMTFGTQNGLARHVPTHFNESRVRRACVLTSEATRQENSKQTKLSSNTSLISSASKNVTTDEENLQMNSKGITTQSRLEKFVSQNVNLTSKYFRIVCQFYNVTLHVQVSNFIKIGKKK